MKLLKKVKRVEVKRCFVLSQRFTSKRMKVKSIKDKKFQFNKETFVQDLRQIKKDVLGLSEKKLDKIISDEYRRRLNAYNKVDWYMGLVDIEEVGIWRGAGGTPKVWAKKSLKETARRLSEEIKKEKSRYKRVRAVRIVPKMMESVDVLKKEKYLLPIILPTGIIPSPRKGMNKMYGYFDDGTMRAFSFVMMGDKQIKAYIGVKKEDQK